MTTHETPDATETAPDADLVLRSRSGDGEAFGELWRRHYRSGVVVARSVTSSIDPDDLVQEAYARIFQAIQRGGGPTGSFRAYLFTSIRNTAAAWGRAQSEQTIDELETLEDPESTDEATLAALDRSLTHTAFRSLPTRWQEVLWYTEIEQLKPAEIAPLLGMKPVAVAQLAFRAREGLREAWIQAHLNSVADGSECQWAIERLGAHTLGNLTAKQRERLDTHLGSCARCAIVASEAKEVGSRLALVLLPLTIGVSATATYLASLQRDDAALVALAAMPSGVVEGAVVAGGGVLAGVGGSGGSSGSSGSSGTVWTVGGLIAAAAAAVAVAGAVVASALNPGGASPTTAPSAADEAAPPAAAVEADPALIDVLANAMEDDAEPAPPRAAPAPKPTLAPVPPRATAPVTRSAAPAVEIVAPAPTEVADEIVDEVEALDLELDGARVRDDGLVELDVRGDADREVAVYALSDATTAGGGLSVGMPLAVAMAGTEPAVVGTLGPDGTATLVVSLTHEQALADVTLEVAYTSGEGAPASLSLSGLGIRDALLAALAPEEPETPPTTSEPVAPTDLAPIEVVGVEASKESGEVRIALRGAVDEVAAVTAGGAPVADVRFDSTGLASVTLGPEVHGYALDLAVAVTYPETSDTVTRSLGDLLAGQDILIDSALAFAQANRGAQPGEIVVPLSGEPDVSAQLVFDGAAQTVRFDSAGLASAALTPAPQQWAADATLSIRYTSPVAQQGEARTTLSAVAGHLAPAPPAPSLCDDVPPGQQHFVTSLGDVAGATLVIQRKGGGIETRPLELGLCVDARDTFAVVAADGAELLGDELVRLLLLSR
ncbi:sigma-70 family RNA polymerase sigma factor [Microbacterium lacusdiani]